MSPSELLPPPCLSAQRSVSSSKRPANNIRQRLTQYHTLEHAVDLLKTQNSIVVLTGAGISTSVGIPDFRSNIGLYTLLENNGFERPEEILQLETLHQDPDLLYRVLAYMAPPDDLKPSPTHAFIKLLQDKGKLLTNYTQNIDGLEEATGIKASKLVQCHGTLSPGRCMTCGHRYNAKRYIPMVRQGGRIGAPRCGHCCDPTTGLPRRRMKRQATYREQKRKRAWADSSDEDEAQNAGIIRPSMVLYGEALNDFELRLEEDRTKVDLLLIIGTSLAVRPVSDILTKIPADVPQIFISKEPCQTDRIRPDIELRGLCDTVVEELARKAGWSSCSGSERTSSVAIKPLEGGEVVHPLNVGQSSVKKLLEEAGP